jgi:hypothetical protein
MQIDIAVANAGCKRDRRLLVRGWQYELTCNYQCSPQYKGAKPSPAIRLITGRNVA